MKRFALVIENILQAMRGDGGDRGRGGGGGGGGKEAAAGSVDIRMHVRNFVQMYLDAYMAVCTYECVCVKVCMCNTPLTLSPGHYPLSNASASIFTKYRALAVSRRQAWLQLRILELRRICTARVACSHVV